jgi:hypothetical protein
MKVFTDRLNDLYQQAPRKVKSIFESVAGIAVEGGMDLDSRVQLLETNLLAIRSHFKSIDEYFKIEESLSSVDNLGVKDAIDYLKNTKIYESDLGFQAIVDDAENKVSRGMAEYKIMDTFVPRILRYKFHNGINECLAIMESRFNKEEARILVTKTLDLLEADKGFDDIKQKLKIALTLPTSNIKHYIMTNLLEDRVFHPAIQQLLEQLHQVHSIEQTATKPRFVNNGTVTMRRGAIHSGRGKHIFAIENRMYERSNRGIRQLKQGSTVDGDFLNFCVMLGNFKNLANGDLCYESTENRIVISGDENARVTINDNEVLGTNHDVWNEVKMFEGVDVANMVLRVIEAHDVIKPISVTIVPDNMKDYKIDIIREGHDYHLNVFNSGSGQNQFYGKHPYGKIRDLIAEHFNVNIDTLLDDKEERKQRDREKLVESLKNRAEIAKSNLTGIRENLSRLRKQTDAAMKQTDDYINLEGKLLKALKEQKLEHNRAVLELTKLDPNTHADELEARVEDITEELVRSANVLNNKGYGEGAQVLTESYTAKPIIDHNGNFILAFSGDYGKLEEAAYELGIGNSGGGVFHLGPVTNNEDALVEKIASIIRIMEADVDPEAVKDKFTEYQGEDVTDQEALALVAKDFSISAEEVGKIVNVDLETDDEKTPEKEKNEPRANDDKANDDAEEDEEESDDEESEDDEEESDDEESEDDEYKADDEDESEADEKQQVSPEGEFGKKKNNWKIPKGKNLIGKAKELDDKIDKILSSKQAVITENFGSYKKFQKIDNVIGHNKRKEVFLVRDNNLGVIEIHQDLLV